MSTLHLVARSEDHALAEALLSHGESVTLHPAFSLRDSAVGKILGRMHWIIGKAAC